MFTQFALGSFLVKAAWFVVVASDGFPHDGYFEIHLM